MSCALANAENSIAEISVQAEATELEATELRVPMCFFKLGVCKRGKL
jgi:hypothetical protein